MDELFTRHPANPILTADNWPYPINAVFNPAATMVGNETVLLVRCEDRRGISHLSVARSDDGYNSWKIDPEPLLSPTPGVDTEQWGFEDPRISYVPEMECFVITCTAYGPAGPAVFLATTNDFRSIERRGLIMPPDDKNAAVLPRRVNGEWILLHRPTGAHTGHRQGDIWLSRSTDLISWKTPERVMTRREGPWWDAVRIGLGPCPMETPDGWLMVYHGVKEMPSGPIYRPGVALLSLEDPTVVLHRSQEWLLTPITPYERNGDVPNVIFPCGMVHDETSDVLRIYYGAADSSVAVASAKLSEIISYLKDCPPN